MLSSDFLFPRFFVVPLANPSNFSHCKCFSSQMSYDVTGGGPMEACTQIDPITFSLTKA